METPEGFKMTELGPLPEEWEVVRLGEVCRKRNETVVPQQSNNLRYVGLEHIDLNEPALHRWGNSAEVRSAKNIFYIGDVLYGKLRPYLDKAVLAPWEGMCSTDILVLMANKQKSLAEFIVYILHTNYFLAHAISTTSGTNHPRTSWKAISSFEFSLPSLPEQKKIAAVLSCVQEAKEKTEAVINATRELKKSLMKHLFTCGPVPVNEAENVPLKETEIGLVPEEWGMVRLGDIIRKTEQRDPRRTPAWRFKYIDVSSINRATLKIEDYKLYKGENAPSRAKKIVRQGDTIFATVRPTLKRITIIDNTFDGEICSTAFCVLRANGNLAIPLYLFYAVGRHTVIDGLGKIQRGASYPAVTDSDVKNQKISLPPLPTQQKIADILSTVDKKIEAEENKKKALEELFKTLLHQLMTGKIRLNYQLKNDKINRGGSYYD